MSNMSCLIGFEMLNRRFFGAKEARRGADGFMAGWQAGLIGPAFAWASAVVLPVAGLPPPRCALWRDEMA